MTKPVVQAFRRQDYEREAKVCGWSLAKSIIQSDAGTVLLNSGLYQVTCCFLPVATSLGQLGIAIKYSLTERDIL